MDKLRGLKTLWIQVRYLFDTLQNKGLWYNPHMIQNLQQTVKLVSQTLPSDELLEQGIEDIQELIAFCARVSNPSNQLNTETTDKLIGYLIKHKHWSPLEMATVCLEINTPRDIARQILRHRSFSFQEFSQRYADPTKDLSFSIREPRLQDTKNRQASNTTDDIALVYEWSQRQANVIALVNENYKWAIQNGIAKECARVILPEGNTMSKMYMIGSLRSWIHYIEIRSGVETQKEHREIALLAAQEIAKVFPMIQQFIKKENNEAR